MRKGKIKAIALLLGAVLFLSPAVSVRAEMSETHETGVQTIVYEGEVYELYKVEQLPAVTVFSENSEEGLKTVRTITNSYYRSARATNIVTGEVVNDTYTADGTLIATVKQTTEWHFHDGWLNIAPDLLSADTKVTYKSSGTIVTIEKSTTYTDTTYTKMYIVPYEVFHKGILYNEEIYTECDVYGRVW